MKWGVDAAFAPQPAGAAHLVALGYSFIAGYIGGRAENVWSPTDWAAVVAAGLAPLPIWVAPIADAPHDQGVTEGNEALQALQALGLSGVCVLDVENGADLTTYAGGWNDAMHAGSCSTMLYGNPRSLEVLAETVSFDYTWLASWPASPLPLMQAPPAFHVWQYASGESFDFNIAWDEFPFAAASPYGS